MSIFSDLDKAWPSAIPSIERVVKAGLMQGDSVAGEPTFRPTDPISRQELAIVLDRMVLLEKTIEDNQRIDLLCKVANQTVQINTETPTGVSVGSGVFVAQNRVLTNAHVVDGATRIEVTWPSPYRSNGLSAHTGPIAQVIAVDPQADLALLNVFAPQVTPVSTDPAWAVPPVELNSANFIGRRVYVHGSPLGAGGRISEGIFNGIRGGFSATSLFDMDIHVNPGNSGGPIFDRDGDLVGIVVAKWVDTAVEGFGFGIPLHTVQAFLQANGITINS